MTSPVTQTPAASPEDAVAHFAARLTFEADCWDTHEAMKEGVQDFVLLDVRSPSLYRRSHIPGAINLPHGKLIASKLSQWPSDILFVVYCAGPHCNGANKAALRLAKLGRPTKELIGGMTGWADEGFAYFAGDEPGHVDDVE
ncbi:MAG TPA: rhodanese-like domain-containing protein [Woeseiaceae bacterium]|nr:rhodanese-like domain-containing protein [Woeseiaceae bacterium]